MNHLSVDIETYSDVDINKYGLYKYAQSPAFQIMLLAFKWDAMTTYIYDFMMEPDPFQLSVLRQALQDPRVIKHAYNAAFEWYCLNRAGFNTPLEQWRCTQAHGLYCGYPAGLGNLNSALGLPDDKKKSSIGKALIKTFCVPQAPTKTNKGRTRIMPADEPEKWQLFRGYCIQDVEAEYESECRLAAWPMPPREQELWQLDCLTNMYGAKVDLQLVEGALACASQVEEELLGEAMAISGLDNPKSKPQLKAWLEDELDEILPNLRKETVKQLLGRDLPDEMINRMLQINQQISKTSVKKYDAMYGAMCSDGRIRGLLQYYGANRTGRYAGRMVQIQNLPKNYLKTLGYARELVCQRNVDMIQLMYGNVPDTLSQLIRTAFVPEADCFYLVADFSAIEARVIAWLAGEEWRLDVFRTTGKIYEASAEQMFHLEPGSVGKDDPMRQRGKVAELALGFGGAAGALIAMGALGYGVTEEELPDIVDRWRAASPRIVELWKLYNAAAIRAVETWETQYVRLGNGTVIFAHEFDPAYGADYLTIQLPVGRKLFYIRPRIINGKFNRPALQYWGVDQETKKWGLIDTFGGKIAENVVQAIARDCLAEILLRLRDNGYQTVFHVHDEVIVESQVDALAEILAMMADPIPWAPGLPLKGAGFTTAEYYRKD